MSLLPIAYALTLLQWRMCDFRNGNWSSLSWFSFNYISRFQTHLLGFVLFVIIYRNEMCTTTHFYASLTSSKKELERKHKKAYIPSSYDLTTKYKLSIPVNPFESWVQLLASDPQLILYPSIEE